MPTQSLWDNYGFQDNPFDTTALSSYQKSCLSIHQAFVDRGSHCQASQLVNNILSGKGGNRFVLEGEVGVGKTTFINYYKYLWEKESPNRLFTPARELTFSASWTLKEFLLNLLSLLTNKVLLVKGEKFVQKHPLFQELMVLNKVFQSYSFQVEANFWGWGGGVGRKREVSVPPISEAQLIHYYQEGVSAILELGYKGVLLHFDNLELLSKESILQARKVFDEIRDVLQLRHVYYIFVAESGFFEQVIAPLPRVRSIFLGWPLFLEPLSLEETLKVIRLRYSLLSIPGIKYIEPVEESFIEYLYNIYEGQLRFLMDGIQAIVLHTSPLFPKTLSKKEALPLLKKIVKERMSRNLSPKELEILSAGAHHEKFTPSNISKMVQMASQNVTKYIRSLMEKGYLRFLRKEGRQTFYKVAEDLKVLKIFSQDPHFPSASSGASHSPSSLNPRQRQFMEKDLSSINVASYSQQMEVSSVTARRDLNQLEEWNFVRRFKRGRVVYYEKN